MGLLSFIFGKPKTPKPDPNIGKAAIMQAEIGMQAQKDAREIADQQLEMGREYQSWMMERAAVTDGWAAEDRSRYTDTFVPLQDDWIAEATSYDSPERKAMAADEAVADVRQQFALGRQQTQRQEASMGVRPGSGRSRSSANRMQATESLGAAGAANAARRNTEATGRQLRASAINMGAGLAVNPATSRGMGTSAGTTGMNAAVNGINSAGNSIMGGANAAMAGQQGMINGLNTQFNQQMAGYNAQNAFLGDIAGGLGTAAGFAMMSSKDAKTNKTKAMSSLDAIKKMPVEEWEYKKGMGDGGGKRHVGPYAEDFKKATGLGNGKEISVIDAMGVTMGAVQELAGKVDKLATA
ncbi:tail fiber domain-containing protein [Yoonia sp.]|uniref:tail fiber domain-containing protein n=1 Tax=Yoonia sp. TaxID=2212373 RepID=UPI002DFD0E35|nr:tail fiber domain-containing protein [Yoonia sp.]